MTTPSCAAVTIRCLCLMKSEALAAADRLQSGFRSRGDSHLLRGLALSFVRQSAILIELAASAVPTPPSAAAAAGATSGSGS